MTTPYIPPELIEAIIEQLAGSPTSLRACALVCNAWLPIAFRVLFRKFAIRVYGKSSDPNISATRVHGTLFSLSKLHTGLIFPHYVSSLTIGNRPGQEILPNILERTLSLFDRASKICIYYEFKPHLLGILHQTHAHLREFEITSAPFPNTLSLQAFVAALSHLEHLSMSYYSFGMRHEAGADNRHPSDLSPPPRLSSLVYKSSDAHRAPFLCWLSDHQPTIKHLSLLSLTPKELEPTTTLFRALGPHLRSLGISYGEDISQPQTPTCLPLQANIQLHTLRICRIPFSFADLIPHLCLTSTILDSTSSTLRCIALQLARSGISNDTHSFLAWGDVDVMLSRRAPALECLHVHVLDTPLYEYSPFMRALLEAQMPWCSQRGVLRGMDMMISHRVPVFPLHERLPLVAASGP